MKAAPSGRKPSFDQSNPQGRQSGSAALVGSAEAAGAGAGDAMGARRFSTGTLQQLEGATADAVAAGGACQILLATSSTRVVNLVS